MVSILLPFKVLPASCRQSQLDSRYQRELAWRVVGTTSERTHHIAYKRTHHMVDSFWLGGAVEASGAQPERNHPTNF
jgi:hypothetical protein